MLLLTQLRHPGLMLSYGVRIDHPDIGEFLALDDTPGQEIAEMGPRVSELTAGFFDRDVTGRHDRGFPLRYLL